MQVAGTLSKQPTTAPTSAASVADWLRCPPRVWVAGGLNPGRIIPVSIDLFFQWLPDHSPAVTVSSFNTASEMTS